MPGMPDDASVGLFLGDIGTRINTMSEADQIDLIDTIGNVPSRNRMASKYIREKDWFGSTDPLNPNKAMEHVQNHWLDNRPGAGKKKVGWWRKSFADRSDRDNMVDRVMTQALWWSVFLRRNRLNDDNTFTALDPADHRDSVRMWMCAGDEFKVVLWQTEKQIIVIYMTPSSPDKIKNYLRYRREHKKHVEGDTEKEIYQELEREVKVYPEPPLPTGGNPEPFIFVTDDSPNVIPPGLQNHVFDGTEKVVKDVISYRPYSRSGELTQPFPFPPAI